VTQPLSDTDTNALKPCQKGVTLPNVEALRQCEVQALGAALSHRSWHATEQAYNVLRDRIDAMLGEERRARAAYARSMEGTAFND